MPLGRASGSLGYLYCKCLNSAEQLARSGYPLPFREVRKQKNYHRTGAAKRYTPASPAPYLLCIRPTSACQNARSPGPMLSNAPALLTNGMT
jgi:hypothetical protein